MRFTLGLLILIVLADCSPTRPSRSVTRSVIYSEKKSKFGYIRIRKISDSSLGHADAIAEKYVGNKIVYRLHYRCSLSETKKEMYTYCSRGMLLIIRTYDGTDEPGTDYDSRLSPLDKFVLHKIDSFIQVGDHKAGGRALCRMEIRGFKKNSHQ